MLCVLIRHREPLNSAFMVAPSQRQPAWHRSYGYDLRRLVCDYHNRDCNAIHEGAIQRFLNLVYLPALLRRRFFVGWRQEKKNNDQ